MEMDVPVPVAALDAAQYVLDRTSPTVTAVTIESESVALTYSRIDSAEPWFLMGVDEV